MLHQHFQLHTPRHWARYLPPTYSNLQLRLYPRNLRHPLSPHRHSQSPIAARARPMAEHPQPKLPSPHTPSLSPKTITAPPKLCLPKCPSAQPCLLATHRSPDYLHADPTPLPRRCRRASGDARDSGVLAGVRCYGWRGDFGVSRGTFAADSSVSDARGWGDGRRAWAKH